MSDFFKECVLKARKEGFAEGFEETFAESYLKERDNSALEFLRAGASDKAILKYTKIPKRRLRKLLLRVKREGFPAEVCDKTEDTDLGEKTADPFENVFQEEEKMDEENFSNEFSEWKEGFKKGYSQGFFTSYDIRFDEGKKEKRDQMILRMLREELSPSLIRKIAGVSRKKLRKLTQEFKELDLLE